MSGEIDLIAGYLLNEDGETVDLAKLNRLVRELVARVQAGSITAREIADGAITADKLSATLEQEFSIPNDSITTAKLADSAVSSAKLAAAAVSAVKLAADVAGDGLTLDGATNALKALLDGVTLETSSGTQRVRDGGITAAKLAATAVVSALAAASAAGDGLVADTGTNKLAVDPDGVTLDLHDGKVRVNPTFIEDLYLVDGSVTLAKLAAESLPNVVQAANTGMPELGTLTSTVWADLPLLSVAITPVKTASKVLLQVHLHGKASSKQARFRLVRGSTAIGVNTFPSGQKVAVTLPAGSADTVSFSWLDEPNTTSETTYKVQYQMADSGGSFDMNLAAGLAAVHGVSTLTAQEIKAI